MFGGHKHCGRENVKCYSLSNDAARETDQRVKGLYGLQSKVSYHPAKSGGHKHSGSGDIKSLVCHVMTSLAPAWLVSFESTPLNFQN